MKGARTIKRPYGVTLLVALVLMFTGLQLLRVWATVANWQFLATLPLRASPLFFVISGLAWGIGGAWLAVGLYRGQSWAPRALQIGAIAFSAFYWTDRLWLQAQGPQRGNMPFEAFVSGMLLVSIFGILAPASMGAYFGAEQ